MYKLNKLLYDYQCIKIFNVISKYICQGVLARLAEFNIYNLIYPSLNPSLCQKINKYKLRFLIVYVMIFFTPL